VVHTDTVGYGTYCLAGYKSAGCLVDVNKK